MRPRVKSFSKKWTVAFVGVFLLVFISTGFFIARQISREEVQQVRNFLTQEAGLTAKIVQPLLQSNAGRSKMQVLVLGLRRGGEERITVIDPAGVVLGDSYGTLQQVQEMDNHRERPEVVDAFRAGVGTSIRNSLTLRREMLYVAIAVKDQERVLGVVRFSVPMDWVHQRVAAVRRPIVIGSAAGVFLILAAGFFLGRWMTANMRLMTMAAVQYTRGDFSRKIVIDSDDELRVLADSMNHMAASLKHRIREAEQEQLNLGMILENMAEGVLAVDAEGQVMVINSSAADILGVSREASLGKNFLEVGFNHRLHEMIEQSIRVHGIISGEIEIRRPDVRMLKVNAVGTAAAEGRALGILVFHDVTQIRRLERLRRDFVANVSHELKTPITSIKGFIETLLGGALKDREQSERFLKMMDEDAHRLHRLVQDLLELSKIESREAPLKKSVCDIAVETKKTFDKLRFLAEEHRVELEINIEPGQAQVLADRDQLDQILLNLVENGIKFNKPGGKVTLDAGTIDGQVRVEVRDTGIGIPAVSLPRIFERFYRVDAGRSRAEGGTGLGLAIVKHILEAHGGTVTCSSELGGGSTFVFTLAAAG